MIGKRGYVTSIWVQSLNITGNWILNDCHISNPPKSIPKSEPKKSRCCVRFVKLKVLVPSSQQDISSLVKKWIRVKDELSKADHVFPSVSRNSLLQSWELTDIENPQRCRKNFIGVAISVLFGCLDMYLCIEVIQIQLKKKSHRLPHKKHPMIHIKMLRFGLFLDGQFLGSYFATFAGKTSSRPRLFSKDLALKDLPRLYKAADAFVLPTRGVRRLAMENKYHPDESSFRNMKNLYTRHSKSFF